jgi:predicted CxxxxCH...CXXCH cytochrome family protein
MSQIKKMTMVVTFLVLGFFMLTGCSDPNAQSVFDSDSGTHPVGWLPLGHVAAAKADNNSCSECHGADYSGGISGYSCFQCHTGFPFTSTDCVSCHATPPAGSAAPNRKGAHSAHNVLPGVTNVCATCHLGAGSGTNSHVNKVVDVQFLDLYNAKSGAAVRNTDGTCSNVSCHGGQTTPAWLTGKIDTNLQCTACHAHGDTQYNSFSSGLHVLHVTTLAFPCVACHGTAALAVNHFTTLNTPAMEGSAAATITGVGIISYSNGSCTAHCHNAVPKNW